MTDRGLPIVDGAPACPFVAFEDDRDERATSPDHRHRCYAEANPAPRALAHQEAYCLSSAFPVCPTFQDWARREAARARGQNARRLDDDGDAIAAAGADGDLDADQPQRNPPRNWAAPPPWLSRGSRSSRDERFEDDGEDDDADPFPAQGRGLSGSYADRVASGGGDSSAAAAAGIAAADAAHAAANAAAAAAAARSAPSEGARPEPTYRAPGWDEEPDDPPEPPRLRRRERDAGRPSAPGPGEGRDSGGRGLPRHDRPAPEWERAKPLEAYPTLKSRRLSELSVPPILVAVVALALSAAVLFALPGLLGFGSPSAGGSPTPTLPVQTAVPSINPTPVPEPTLRIYVVKAGDTMSKIAGKFGLTLQQLIDANSENIPNPDTLQIGDQVIIPAKNPDELPAASEIPGAT